MGNAFPRGARRVRDAHLDAAGRYLEFAMPEIIPAPKYFKRETTKGRNEALRVASLNPLAGIDGGSFREMRSSGASIAFALRLEASPGRSVVSLEASFDAISLVCAQSRQGFIKILISGVRERGRARALRERNNESTGTWGN